MVDDVLNNDGLIRLEVVAGTGGTGEAALVEVVRSDEGLRSYLNADGDAVEAVRKVHAGDTEIYLVFKYTPVETITDGSLRVTVPDDWSPPQDESSSRAGFTTVNTSANTETPVFENRVITVPIVSIDTSAHLLRFITVQAASVLRRPQPRKPVSSALR